MAYGQINYSQKLGNGAYSIAETGCFVTAFCNLLERFGEPIDPPSLNNYFNQHGNYLLAPYEGAGIRDDVSWGTISAYDGQIVVVGIGGAGWPDSNDAIVKFIYKSPRSGNTVPHFTLMADHTTGSIVDSYDGVTKRSPYGVPVAWAKYERHTPQPVVPPAPVEEPAFTIEPIGERTEQLKIDTKLWDLNQRSWPALVNNPVGTANAGTDFQTSNIAHHVLGGSYYLPNGSTTQGYNVVDCENPPAPVAPPAPVVAPTPPTPQIQSYATNTIDGITYSVLPVSPKQMWISNPLGAEKWNFENVHTWREFKSVQHLDYGSEIFITGKAHHPIPPSGADYYMTTDDFGNFKKTGRPDHLYGFNWSDISDTRPKPLPAKPAPAPAPVAEVVAPTPTIVGPVELWQSTYRPFVDSTGTPTPIKYVAVKPYDLIDLATPGKAAPLHPGDNILISGLFEKDGQTWGRAKASADINKWHAVPMNSDIVEKYDVLYDTTTTVAQRQSLHTLKTFDYVVLGYEEIRRIGATIQKAWDSFPFKNKK